MLKLAAIYNVWDGDELMDGSIQCLDKHVDHIIIVYQNVSNYGEVYYPHLAVDPMEWFGGVGEKHTIIEYTPNRKLTAGVNETRKRNLGLNKARELGCTHFLHLDCDEYYQDFGNAKALFFESGAKGSVCPLHTYFKKPTLRLDYPENYFVPFIHELRPDTIAGARKYPYWVDPTRRINETKVIELPVYMHHYSYVRKDIGRKIRNSTARKTIEKKHFVDYQRDLKAGDYLPCFERKLIEVPDYFNINSML
jgi:hypothetical protein